MIFRDAVASTWLGQAENDGFNRLVLAAGLTWRQTAVLRAFCRYLLQTGIPFSQAYMEQVLSANAGISRLLAPALPHAVRSRRSRPAVRARECHETTEADRSRRSKP